MVFIQILSIMYKIMDKTSYCHTSSFCRFLARKKLTKNFYFLLEYSWFIMCLSVQQLDSVNIGLYLFCFGLFSYLGYYSVLLSSLYYTVGPHWLTCLYILMCICSSQPPHSSLPPPHLSCLVTLSLFSKVWVTVFPLQMSSFALIFRFYP